MTDKIHKQLKSAGSIDKLTFNEISQTTRVFNLYNEQRSNKQLSFEDEIEPISPRRFKGEFGYLDNNLEQSEVKNKIYDLLEKLEQEKGIEYRIALEQHYLQGRTLRDIGKMLHVSCQMINQINKKAMKYLRETNKYSGLELYK